MISAKVMFLGGGVGAALTVVTAVITVQADTLTLVERYGLLGLHAAVVLGLGGFMVRVGWEQVRLSRSMAASMRKIVERQGEAKEEHAEILREVRELQQRPRR